MWTEAAVRVAKKMPSANGSLQCLLLAMLLNRCSSQGFENDEGPEIRISIEATLQRGYATRTSTIEGKGQ